MGIHESQSRFYENILGRSKNFWMPIYDKLGEYLPQFREIPLDDFYREINHVRNSFVRIEADEVTYCLHIILRYEMEQAIFRGHVPVEELPALWNKKMEEYLQITPENDSEGILQDIHWSDGSFGYFPTYLLGSIYDGMYLEAIEQELGSVDEILAAGEIFKITKWLNENIHWYGSTRTPKEVIEAVCGKEVSAEPLLRYFKKKYTEIYSLS
jgi:carboxypeptidase Taq